MATTTWNVGDPINYVEIITQATVVARGGAVKNVFNIFYFRRTTTVNPLSKAHIDAAFQTAIGAKILLALNQDYTQTKDTVRYFEDATNAPTAFALSGTGALTNQRGSGFECCTIQLKTGARGKLGRGSKHFSPLDEASYLGDTLTSAGVTVFTNLGAAIVAGFTDSDGNVWVPGLKRAPRIGFPEQYKVNPTTTTWTDVTSGLLNKSIGTMRRRKIKTVN